MSPLARYVRQMGNLIFYEPCTVNAADQTVLRHKVSQLCLDHIKSGSFHCCSVVVYQNNALQLHSAVHTQRPTPNTNFFHILTKALQAIMTGFKMLYCSVLAARNRNLTITVVQKSFFKVFTSSNSRKITGERNISYLLELWHRSQHTFICNCAMNSNTLHNILRRRRVNLLSTRFSHAEPSSGNIQIIYMYKLRKFYVEIYCTKSDGLLHSVILQ